jgi:predicted RNA-binding protein
MEEDETVAEAIREIVKKSEHGDSKTIALVHKAYKLVLE